MLNTIIKYLNLLIIGIMIYMIIMHIKKLNEKIIYIESDIY